MHGKYNIKPKYVLQNTSRPIDFKLKILNTYNCYDFMQTLWDPITYVHTEYTSI